MNMLDQQRATDIFVVSVIASLEAFKAADNVAQAFFSNQKAQQVVDNVFNNQKVQQAVDNVVCDQSDPEERERAWHNIEKKSKI